MPKVRLLILISTFTIVGIIGIFAILFARGYRLQLDENSLNLAPRGLMVANSDPNGAQVYVNGELKTATDNTISLSPNIYDIVIKKEGFFDWKKRVTIEKEIVTQIDAYLIASAPSLTALTFSGAINPSFSTNFSKIAYVVPLNGTPEKAGLWILETADLPLGFSRDPRQITNGDLSGATWLWSPDGREILLYMNNGVFLLDTGDFTAQKSFVNVATKEEAILAEWAEEEQKKLDSSLSKLEGEIEKVISRNGEDFRFSPDENRILYKAAFGAAIPEGIVKELPGASTQQQERSIKQGKTYVYDIKEDRNFAVGEDGDSLSWLPNSLNLLLPKEDGVYIKDYDGTNTRRVYAGGYTFPHAFATTSSSQILILTNLGAEESVPNLYWLGLK